jgi:cytochrome P450
VSLSRNILARTLTQDRNVRFKSLTSKNNPLASAMRDQINIQVRDEEMNPLRRYSLFQLYREHRNSHTMDSYITAELHKRYAEYLSAAIDSKSLAEKSIIDLVIVHYMRDRPASATLDRSFIRWACAQIRLFLFVGHDSTASTIVYSLYLLSKHPKALSRIREEHTAVFGADISTTPAVLRASPKLINQLPFTTAVIKESLRLFPPAAGFRGGEPGAYITDSHGTRFPTEGTGLNVLHNGIHRNPRYWPRPDDFVPERWLVSPEHELYPRTKGAWRPFEYGTRNCPGQTLVMLDVKVTLALVVREFDVTDAYAEWDAKNKREGEVKDVDGERAYQVGKGSAHPSDGFPCRFVRREHSG